jgi:hypothetical protein
MKLGEARPAGRFVIFLPIKKVKAVNPSPQYGRKYHPPLTSSTKATLLL